MLTDPKLKSQVDQLWNKLWSGGLTNPLDAIELYKPPYSRQSAFAHILEKYARVRIQQREALRQAEHLFQALLRRAFVG